MGGGCGVRGWGCAEDAGLVDELICWVCLVSEPHSLAKDFSNGYLLGEVLSRYQLQEDFQSFSTNRSALLHTSLHKSTSNTVSMRISWF